MLKYVLKRIGMALLTLLIITFLLFFLVRVMPGNPFPSERMSAEQIANKRAEMGLDDPILPQFVRYMGNVLQGDFGKGTSLYNGAPIKTVLSTAISNKDVLPSHCSVGLVDAEKLKYGKPFSVTYPAELSSSLMPVASHQKVAGREEIRFPTSSEASPRILVKILFSYWTNSINAQGNLSTVPMARTTPKSSKTRSLHSLIMTHCSSVPKMDGTVLL